MRTRTRKIKKIFKKEKITNKRKIEKENFKCEKNEKREQ